MQSSIIAIILAAATGTIAAPANIHARCDPAPAPGTVPPPAPGSATPPKAPTTPATANYILPNAMAVHNVNNNANKPSTQILTTKKGNTETSTLVSFQVPSTATGTCKTHINVGALGGADKIGGSQTVRIFRTLLTNIPATPTGNQRNIELGQLRFDAAAKGFAFEKGSVQPTIQTFPCPAGKTIQWEIVAVGDSDEIIVGQDFTSSGAGVPNGIYIEY
ncbi:hypothetical protein JDV02_002859 [Purpureocillium takamizusanense]|uniref:Ubiquitin 3 binding protein But2 C-terminal domain-containing protein n=1 Tax=Purpureocillium takamizusanense TaxID=2060973 RepID=A0A9Q8V947_9HYPO|nr:uncharacterized protein JDV02_002859 [Purpureocillium takamizusanense]UNI16427.1 hypothetical protein JDV02_002859 [Purpureocillium takamizusanense]